MICSNRNGNLELIRFLPKPEYNTTAESFFKLVEEKVCIRPGGYFNDWTQFETECPVTRTIFEEAYHNRPLKYVLNLRMLFYISIIEHSASDFRYRLSTIIEKANKDESPENIEEVNKIITFILKNLPDLYAFASIAPFIFTKETKAKKVGVDTIIHNGVLMPAESFTENDYYLLGTDDDISMKAIVLLAREILKRRDTQAVPPDVYNRRCGL